MVSFYIKHIQHKLPETHTGVYCVMMLSVAVYSLFLRAHSDQITSMILLQLNISCYQCRLQKSVHIHLTTHIYIFTFLNSYLIDETRFIL